MSRTFVVTIDGPAGAGKSTVARELARHKGWFFLDTGAMYRAVAWKALEQRLNISDGEILAMMIRSSTLQMTERGVELDGRDISTEIRTPEIGDVASRIATLPPVRRELVELQRKQREGRAGLVTEGRDQGTVVFPDADLKVFLDASLDVRARRRFKELQGKGRSETLHGVEKDIRDRDRRDQSRAASPLARAKGALDIDTSKLTIAQVVGTILKHLP